MHTTCVAVAYHKLLIISGVGAALKWNCFGGSSNLSFTQLQDKRRTNQQEGLATTQGFFS